MPAEPECIACNVPRTLIQVTPVARGYEMRSLECPQCSNVFRLVLRHPRPRAKNGLLLPSRAERGPVVPTARAADPAALLPAV
jgi:hypothetical protein